MNARLAPAALLFAAALAAFSGACGGDDKKDGMGTANLSPELRRVRDADFRMHEAACRIESTCDPANFAKTPTGKQGIEQCVATRTATFGPLDSQTLRKIGCADQSAVEAALTQVVDEYETCVNDIASRIPSSFCQSIIVGEIGGGEVGMLIKFDEIPELRSCAQAAQTAAAATAGRTSSFCAAAVQSIFLAMPAR